MHLFLIRQFCLTTLFRLASPIPLSDQLPSIHQDPDFSLKPITNTLSARAPIPAVSYSVTPLMSGWSFHLLSLDTIINSAAVSFTSSSSMISPVFSAFYTEAYRNALERWPTEMRPMQSFMIGKGNIRVDFMSQIGPIPWALVAWWAQKMGSMSRHAVAGRYKGW